MVFLRVPRQAVRLEEALRNLLKDTDQRMNRWCASLPRSTTFRPDALLATLYNLPAAGCITHRVQKADRLLGPGAGTTSTTARSPTSRRLRRKRTTKSSFSSRDRASKCGTRILEACASRRRKRAGRQRFAQKEISTSTAAPGHKRPVTAVRRHC